MPAPLPPERKERAAARPPHSEVVPKTKLSLAVGKRDGIRPADVVGSIANEANVPGREIGPIEIRDDVTYVMIPNRYVDQVLQKVRHKRFRGRALNVRVANANAPANDRPKKPAFGKFIKKKPR